MGDEEVTAEVAEAVENGSVSPDKPDKDVIQEKEGDKEGVEEMVVDIKDDEKDKNNEDNVDKEDLTASKIAEEVEVKQVHDNREDMEEKPKDEAKSEALEVNNATKPDEGSKSKNTEVGNSKEKAERLESTVQRKGSQNRESKKDGGEEDNIKKGKEKKEKQPKTPVGPTIERPVRERKSVERLVAVIDKETVREFHIEKGRGTALKDIPNVAYKLSKRKVADDSLKLLHTILFGRRGKASQIKSNILRFSGFVWHENEEKQKLKVQEKLEKCNKEKLLEFCDLLDIPITKKSAKKEDVVVKLIDFLLVPHATTSKLLAEKEQSSKGKKRKRGTKKNASTSRDTPSKDSSKKQKGKGGSRDDKKNADETDNMDEEENSEEHQDVNDEESEHNVSEDVSEPESGEDSKKRKRGSKQPSSEKESAAKSKSKEPVTLKKSAKSSASSSKGKDKSEATPKTFSRKKKNNAADEKLSTPKKSASKEKNGKRAVKEKEKPKEGKKKPSDDELRGAICEILKEVDFNTATFTDILKELAKRFKTELTARKSLIKLMIQDELTKLGDDDEDEETDV